ncbi:ABC transporter substrate-binding protein [Isoptericola sp. NPDC056605]|uniref:ABC transporter substrate-binding protein n=1 Tax=Isoptericola sp. NPDC056605 TaxID=3345876 RepID=UPI0036A3943B
MTVPAFSVRPAHALLGAALVVALSACSTASQADTGSGEDASVGTLRVGATSVTGTPAGSLGWGDKEGILLDELKDAGVDKIEYSFFQSGKDVVAALLGGAVDVAAVGDNPALTARGNGAEVELLALDSINGDTWLIGAPGGPTTIEGLVGKDVTAPQGTIRDRSAHQLVEAAGLADQIEVKDLGTPESIAGLSSGSVDATLVGGASAVELARKGFPVIDRTSDHGLESTGATIASTEFVDAHPGFREAWQGAVVATNQSIVDRFDEYTQWVAETDGVDVDLVREATHEDEFTLEPYPDAGLDQLQSAHDFLHDDGAFDEAFDVREWAGVA